MMNMSEARYAIYFTPPQGSKLERVCSAILGRCASTGTALTQPAIPGIEPTRLAELTASPRHYGLHATLKPPFFLAKPHDEAALLQCVALIANKTRPFDLPGLELSILGSFLALTPTASCPELEDLARICVTVPDHFRRPAKPEELARRRAKGLTMNQERLLDLWGYPYVLEEMRFHLTLTGSIHDPEERERIRAALTPLLAPVLHTPVPVRDICVFRQTCLAEPFAVLRRFPLQL
jgi:putative phosphonate metabolism protein